MPNLYHSDVHMPRWKRVVLWLVETNLGRALWGLPMIGLACLPYLWFGAWWPVLVVVAALAFSFGWNAAYRRWLRDGTLSKL